MKGNLPVVAPDKSFVKIMFGAPVQTRTQNNLFVFLLACVGLMVILVVFDQFQQAVAATSLGS
ncbi:MAG: hypothetical protein IPK76_22035 [Lewinellaceae bacterium]|nr:hypothetical protein [Lewinellaceae bacterium]